jgi:hypothetical protein
VLPPAAPCPVLLAWPKLNQALQRLLEELNTRPFKKLPGSRRTLFESLDRPALRPLPTEPYVYAEWKRARVHIDYSLRGGRARLKCALCAGDSQVLDVRVTAHTVECFRKGSRVASHPRSSRDRDGTPRYLSTCPKRIGSTRNGRPSGSSTGRLKLDPLPLPRSKVSCAAVPIRNRAFALL